MVILIGIIILITPILLYSLEHQEESIAHLCWSSTDKGALIELTSDSGIRYVSVNRGDGDSLIRTSESIPDFAQSFYFEMKIIDCGQDGAIGIGLATSDADTNIMPGWNKNTIGYHGDDGGIYQGSGCAVEETDTFTTHDVVSCQVKRVRIDELRFGTVIQFGKNGKTVGPLMYMMNEHLHPVIGMGTPGARAKTNLGEDAFAYELKGTLIILNPKSTGGESLRPP